MGAANLRRVRYQVAVSLDGYIAGPNGEADWIAMDPDIDFAAIFQQFDTILMGRKTFLVAGGGGMPGVTEIVFSRTLRAADYPTVQIEAGDPADAVRQLKARSGKDIWLFGGGELFRSLFAAGMVDTIEPAIMPVILGGGTPMFPSPLSRGSLTLTNQRLYQRSGIVLLEYAVSR
jgi:dihydrofolate reductase